MLNNTEAQSLPVSEDIVKAQQETADFQYSIGAIKIKIDVKEVVDNSYYDKAQKE